MAQDQKHEGQSDKVTGLLNGQLWWVQEERLQGLYKKHHEDRTYLAILADKMPGGFSKGQISSQLRKLGLRKSKGKKARGMTEVITTDFHPTQDTCDSLLRPPLGKKGKKLACLQLGGEQIEHYINMLRSMQLLQASFSHSA